MAIRKDGPKQKTRQASGKTEESPKTEQVRKTTSPGQKRKADFPIVGSATGITERIQAEGTLQSSEAWFSTTLRSIGDAVIATDEKAYIKLINPVAQALTGWNEKEAMGKPLGDVFNIVNEETGKQAENPVARVVREGVVVGLANHTALIGKDGTKRSIGDSGAPIRDDKGNIIGTILVFRDVTEIRKTERNLNERVKELGCLYGIASITERPEITLDEIYQETVELLPQSWQYPEVACAQLTIDGKEFKTANYRDTEWKQSTDIKVHGIKAGTVLVGYLEERPASDEGPFWREERLLIDAVAERLGRITERKQAEEALGESEERYRTLFESAAEGILIADIEAKKFKYANPVICTMLGYSQEELTKMSVIDIHPKTALEHVLAEFDAQARGEKILSTLPCLKKDGTIIYADIKAAKAIIDGRECNVGFFTDITELKRAEEALWKSEEKWRSLVENAPNIIMLVDHDGTIQFINRTGSGFNVKDTIGASLYAYIQPEHHNRVREAFDRVFKTGKNDGYEIKGLGPDRSIVWYETRISPIKRDSEVVAMTLVTSDVTERKRMEQVQEDISQQLKVKVDELEAFSYGIAHDLRSPLISIAGFSRELRTDIHDMETERVQEDIRLIEFGVRKMQDFLNSTLEYSRSGQLLKRTKNVSFGKIAKEVVTGFNKQISSIGATVSLAENFPEVYADTTRITQVLANLIQNSIKYRDKTAPLKIKIGHRLSEGEAVFFVQDNGLGIDASQAEKVFSLFYRGTADGEGSGVGLTVVKKIIEAHGGRIWVEQGQSRKGTTMCFTLSQNSDTEKGDNNGKD